MYGPHYSDKTRKVSGYEWEAQTLQLLRLVFPDKEIQRQVKFSSLPVMIVDFYVPSARVAIECKACGLTPVQEEVLLNHRTRQEILESMGIRYVWWVDRERASLVPRTRKYLENVFYNCLGEREKFIEFLRNQKPRKLTDERIMPPGLRDYQIEILKKILEASAAKSKLLISMDVGYGKTAAIAGAFNELFKRGEIRKALVVTPLRKLRDQFLYSLNRYSSAYVQIIKLDSARATQLSQETKPPSILVSTYALFRRIGNLSRDFDLILFDDCENLSARDWATLNHGKTAVIGFTSLHPLAISPNLLSLFGKQAPDYSYGMSSIKLKDLADILVGAAYTRKQLEGKGAWKFVRPRDIKQDGKIDVNTFISESAAKKNAKSALRVGDILLQNIFSFGKIAIVKEKDLPAVVSKNLFIIRSKKMPPDVLFEHLQSKAIVGAFRKQLRDHAHGEIIKHISLRDVGEIPVPLPFSKDQLSEFATMKQSKDIDALKRARDELANLRQAYLESSREE